MLDGGKNPKMWKKKKKTIFKFGLGKKKLKIVCKKKKFNRFKKKRERGAFFIFIGKKKKNPAKYEGAPI